MQIKKLAFTLSLAVGAGVHLPALPASAQDAPAPPRTGLYETVMQGNAAADNTVSDYTKRPTLIGENQRYIAGWGNGPAAAGLNNGAFAIQGMGFTWFGAISAGPGGLPGQGSAPDEVRIGLANQLFGAGLFLAAAKNKVEMPSPGGTDTRTTWEGDALGVFGNLNLGGSDVYGEIAVFTDYDPTVAGNNYVKTEPPAAPSVENKNSRFHAMAGWKKDATTQGTHALNVEGTFDFGRKKDQAPADTGSLIQVGLAMSHGVIVLQTPGTSVFMGGGAQVAYIGETRQVGAAPEVDGSQLNIALRPNMAFQKRLRWGLELFSGGGVSLMYDIYENRGPTAGAEGRWDFMTTGADVAVGIRWSYQNIALEGVLNETFLFNGPNFVSGAAAPLLAQVGLSLGF